MRSTRLSPFSYVPSPSSAATTLRRWITQRSTTASHALDERSVEQRAAIGKLQFLRSLPISRIPRAAGTGIFVAAGGGVDPNAFALFLAAERRLPERVLFVTWHVAHVPHVAIEERVNVTQLGDGILLAAIRHGFNDDIDIPTALRKIDALQVDASSTRYYVTGDGLAGVTIRSMPTWRRWLFAMMSKLCVPAADYFSLPADRTTEI
jgi:KUP system potassium uptake protein